MVLMIPEEGSFSMTANVTAPGFQTVIPKGLLFSRRQGEVWVAPLIPQLFYGADGTQLATWRQYLPSAGSQVILSRVAGKPEVPREELWWRKVSEEKAVELERAAELDFWTALQDLWAEWTEWFQANYIWFLPVVAIIMVPVIAGANIVYDYSKLKGLI